MEAGDLDAAFVLRLVEDMAEEIGAHQAARPLALGAVTGAEAGRAAQIAVRKNVDVEDEAFFAQHRIIR